MLEVHLGSKPGRPALLLVLAAVTLTGALGLAWWQVRAKRALGDEVRIPGTPLAVRPPQGWSEDSRKPGRFVLPMGGRRARAEEVVPARWVSFEYRHYGTFLAPERILRHVDFQDWAESSQPRPARVGPFMGIQVGRLVRQTTRGRVYVQEQVLRLACSPRGDVIIVKYVPLTGLSVPQLELLDEMCATIRLEDPAFTTESDELLRRAGLEFPAEESWRICGPDFPEVPGVYVQAAEEGGPGWALGVFRTWLAEGRTPVDLLTDLASVNWRLSPDDVEVGVSQRDDGATVAVTRHPAFGRAEHDVASVWAVARSPEEAALVIAFADGGFAEQADEIARRVAGAVDFGPTDLLPALGPAAVAGRELAALFRQRGGTPWWGALPTEEYYLNQLNGAATTVVYTARNPLGRAAAAGYRGLTLYMSRGESAPRLESWTIDERARGYTYETEGGVATWRGLTSVHIEERLDADASTGSRTVEIHDRRHRRRFSIGPAFVCPPMETVAEAWVAQRAEGAWLIEATTHFEATTHTRQLRPLPPDEEGRPRALLLIDYWPRGTVLGFDRDGGLSYQVDPGGTYWRASAEAAERRFPRLRSLRPSLHRRLLEAGD